MRLYWLHGNYHLVSKELGVPLKNVHRWVNSFQSAARGKKPADAPMEQRLADHLRQRHGCGEAPAAPQVRELARAMASNPDFSPTIGWYYNFIRRHGLRFLLKPRK